MGEHAEDEIHREMFGCYPWENPTRNNKHCVCGNYKTPVNYSKLRNIIISHKKNVNKQQVRNIMQNYCINILMFDNKKTFSTSNEDIATEIILNKTQFKNWLKETI